MENNVYTAPEAELIDSSNAHASGQQSANTMYYLKRNSGSLAYSLSGYF